ncbi:MAG: transposase [Sphaerospermopsis sp. SIO1G2]|nr:transposase [Sphaerospermopsis sp. SIO1G2]
MPTSYNPDKHRRQSIRWKQWDYGRSAFYFVTICTHQRMHLFDDAQYYAIADRIWHQLPAFPQSHHLDLDEFVIMPNHIHGILHLKVDHIDQSQLAESPAFRNAKTGTLGRIIATYKALVTRQINQIDRTSGKTVWHRGYWDRVIRDAEELNAIRHYIRENPKRWHQGQDNLEDLVSRMTRQSP